MMLVGISCKTVLLCGILLEYKIKGLDKIYLLHYLCSPNMNLKPLRIPHRQPPPHTYICYSVM